MKARSFLQTAHIGHGSDNTRFAISHPSLKAFRCLGAMVCYVSCDSEHQGITSQVFVNSDSAVTVVERICVVVL